MAAVIDGARAKPVSLICLPHAGGNALLYRHWPQALATRARVLPQDLPGHGAQRALAPLTRWPELTDALATRVLSELDANVPFAVMGHSMGALAGVALIREIERRTGKQPVWFGVSACIAPSRRVRETHWLTCTREAMIARLRELGGTHEALLNDREFIDFMLPVLRADFHLCGTYPARAHAGPLPCPIDVFIGRDDSATANRDDVAAWADETRGRCTVHDFDGGHFYLDEQSSGVLAIVEASLADAGAMQPDCETWTL
ncbi:putative thioesterase [Caballeronia novacaledonica]|uniref:Putative thioesterase n=1 Tax=Caballeronia novacaledonica TaxID=1544861 RepID=A0A2U3ID08_9BURK|nr:alpha/beta fold hydrolase [Caballeronia novacaledonica]SPB18001.1 putative thioesterase [Caballeronia novacaledonica]